MKNLFLSLAATGLMLMMPGFASAASTACAVTPPTVDSLTACWGADHIDGHFIEKKTIAGFPKPLVSSGRFSIDRQKGVRWETLKPFPNTLIFDDSGVRYIGSNAESSVSTGNLPAVGQLADLTRGILSGDLKLLARLFDLEVTAHPIPTVRATPKDKNLSGTLREVTISGRNDIETVRLTAASGDITDLTLSHQIRR